MSDTDHLKLDRKISYGNIIQMGAFAAALIGGWVTLRNDAAMANELAKKNAHAIERLIDVSQRQQTTLATMQAVLKLQAEIRNKEMTEIKDALNRIAPRSPLTGMSGMGSLK